MDFDSLSARACQPLLNIFYLLPLPIKTHLRVISQMSFAVENRVQAVT